MIYKNSASSFRVENGQIFFLIREEKRSFFIKSNGTVQKTDDKSNDLAIWFDEEGDMSAGIWSYEPTQRSI